MTALSVNVNKIATLRNTRSLDLPSVERLAAVALRAGAHGITVHPRPDQRHIRTEDVARVAAVVAEFPGAEYNIEGNPFHGLIEHCEQTRPAQATLVPDAREALTSNHGWNLIELGSSERKALANAIARLHDTGARVSLFLDPIVDLLPIALELGADRVELYTEPYAAAFGSVRSEAVLARQTVRNPPQFAGNNVELGARVGGASFEFTSNEEGDARRPHKPSDRTPKLIGVLSNYERAARVAGELGLKVNAGHDLNLENLPLFLAQVPAVAEVSIGHALIADALEFGLSETVQRYRAVCG